MLQSSPVSPAAPERTAQTALSRHLFTALNLKQAQTVTSGLQRLSTPL